MSIFSTHLSHKQNQNGYSFMELLMVVSIVGIFTTAALPAFNELTIRKNLSTAQTTLLQTLNRAKSIAKTQSTIVNVKFENDTITIAPSNTNQDQSFKIPKNISVSNSTTFKFDSMGMIIGVANDKNITLKTSDDFNLQSIVTISPTGLITAGKITSS